jgi:hypothetical protein
MSPNDPNVYWNALSTAIAHLAAGYFDEAIERANRALHDQSRFITAMRAKTAAFDQLGRLDKRVRNSVGFSRSTRS